MQQPADCAWTLAHKAWSADCCMNGAPSHNIKGEPHTASDAKQTLLWMRGLNCYHFSSHWRCAVSSSWILFSDMLWKKKTLHIPAVDRHEIHHGVPGCLVKISCIASSAQREPWFHDRPVLLQMPLHLHALIVNKPYRQYSYRIYPGKTDYRYSRGSPKRIWLIVL